MSLGNANDVSTIDTQDPPRSSLEIVGRVHFRGGGTLDFLPEDSELGGQGARGLPVRYAWAWDSLGELFDFETLSYPFFMPF